MAIDELQLIAQGRATMLMRGYAPLRLTIGVALHRSLGPAVGEDGILLDMPVTIRTDMEGFVISAECPQQVPGVSTD